jgi:hypothetical protein
LIPFAIVRLWVRVTLREVRVRVEIKVEVKGNAWLWLRINTTSERIAGQANQDKTFFGEKVNTSSPLLTNKTAQYLSTKGFGLF